MCNPFGPNALNHWLPMARASALKEMLRNLGKRIKLEALAVLKTNPDGAGIVQADRTAEGARRQLRVDILNYHSRALTFSFE